MIRLLTKSPVLTMLFPFTKKTYDQPVNDIIKPLDDELGWDRVKNIFILDENGMFTKELQSIINITLSGLVIGTGVRGITSARTTVDNFIANNEATRFTSHFDAKRCIQQNVAVNFIKKGGRFGAKVGAFCFLFSSITTFTTAYRGKLAVENYLLSGSITGLLFKINMGLRGALVGTGLGFVLGGLCGTVSVLILKLSGISIDEVLTAQHQWVESRNISREKIKESMESEVADIKKLYEHNKNIQERLQRDVKNENK
ncbi:hypothetical protein PUN28_002326 [Cardiocondyla obscurior]|uniref:Complex I assembly factor TIMMDC1, mitochondrial n=1 Tax=Cardiocondyla obscurior TaxID=286306 RepID=A0AAW2GTK1_9HYME